MTCLPKLMVAMDMASLVSVGAFWQHQHVQSNLVEQTANGEEQRESAHQAVADKMKGIRQMFMEDPAGTLKHLSEVLIEQRRVVKTLSGMLPDLNASMAQQVINGTKHVTADTVTKTPSATTSEFEPLLDVDYILDADNYLEDFINASNIPLQDAPASESEIKKTLQIAAGQRAANYTVPAAPTEAPVTPEMVKLMAANTKLAAQVELVAASLVEPVATQGLVAAAHLRAYRLTGADCAGLAAHLTDVIQRTDVDWEGGPRAGQNTDEEAKQTRHPGASSRAGEVDS